MEYKILKDRYPLWLSKQVTDLLQQGWKPQGGVCFDSRNNEYLQAMVKERSFDPDFFTSGA